MPLNSNIEHLVVSVYYMPRDMHTIKVHSQRSYTRAVNSNRLVLSGAFKGKH